MRTVKDHSKIERKTMRVASQFLIVVFVVSGLYGQKQQMSHEEELVRETYAKVTFAAQLGMLWHAIEMDKGWPGLNNGLALTKSMNDQIRFDLTGFRVGKVSSIGKEPFSFLVDGPVSVILLHYVEMPVGYKKGNSQRTFYITYTDASWRPAPPSPTETLEERAPSSPVPTVKDVLKALRKPSGGGEWAKYASYSVVASLWGRSISYRAAFLFSKDGQEILTLDYATAMGVGMFVKNNMYPSAIVDTAFRELPFAQSWILSNEIAGCKKTKQPEVCCDAVTGQCGIASEDLERSLNTLIDPDMRSFLQGRVPKQQ